VCGQREPIVKGDRTMNDTVYPFDTREQFTKIHNYVIDHMMPTLKPNAFKLLILIIRKTKGWGKDADRISYSQLREGTGIASDATLSAAIKELEELNYIQRERVDGATTNYTLNTTLKVDLFKNCSGTSSKTVVVTSTETVDTKERVKERKESIEADACNGSASPTPSPTPRKTKRAASPESTVAHTPRTYRTDECG